MATHSSTLAWKIPWMEGPGSLQSMGSRRVRHNWVTSLSLFTFMHWRTKWQPLQWSCLENLRDSRARWAAIYGVTQSRTQLKQLSSSSSSRSDSGKILSVLSLRAPAIYHPWLPLMTIYLGEEQPLLGILMFLPASSAQLSSATEVFSEVPQDSHEKRKGLNSTHMPI